ncbi:MAG: alpha/beta fold hydrolase, partial [Actinomycetota bacterium]
MLAETRYAYNGDLAVAYRTLGEGPREIVFVTNWFVSAEAFPEIPSVQPWLEKMATLGRMIFFDQPGTGSSDPVSIDHPPTLEQWTDSITAVLDTVGSKEAALLTIDGSLSTGALFAATHPTRTTALIVMEGYVSAIGDTTTVEGFEALERATVTFGKLWGTGEVQHIMNPEMPWNDEIRMGWAKQERLAASPKMLATLFPLATGIDVTDLLPAIRVPTLVLHHREDPLIVVERGREVARRIPGAKMVEIPGRNIYPFVEPGWRQCFEEISEFLTGVRPEPFEDDRILATVLFTDIV